MNIALICALTVAGLCGSLAAAEELSVQAAISSKRPYLGDPVIFQITVKQRVEKQPDLDAAELEALGAKLVGQPARGHSISTINGVTTEEYSYQYQFRFVPNHAGPLKIPAVTVRQGRQTASTQPFEIEVVGADAQDWAIVQIVPSDRSIYLGQQVTLAVQVMLRRLIHQGELVDGDPFSGREPPQVKISWIGGAEGLEPLQTLESLRQRVDEGPGFRINDLFQRTDLFSLFDDRVSQAAVRFDRDEVERPGLSGERHAYYRYTLPLEYRAVRPSSVGPLTVQFRGTVYTDVWRGPRGLEGDARGIVAVSEPVVISILPLPKVGQPATFTGGVGLFRATATAQPTKLRVGDPITLTVRVTGSGNLESVATPNLSAQEKWSSDFKVHDDASSGVVEDGAKVFTYSVRPRSSSVRELPAVQLSYFNPKRKKYEDTFTERIPLEVAETARLDTAEIVDAAEQSHRELEEIAGGLAANYTGPNVIEPHGPIRLAPAAWLAILLLPPTAWLAAFVWHRRYTARTGDAAGQRARLAHRRAIARLDRASRKPAALPVEIARAVAGYLADRLNLPMGELTPTEARHYALALRAGPDLAARLEALAERCDQARFADSAHDAEFDELLQNTRRLIDEIERNTTTIRVRGRQTAAQLQLLAFGVLATLGGLGHGVAWADERFDRHASLARGNAAFERGARANSPVAAQQAFQEAIVAYEQLVSDGVENGRLYYNLANAYFRAGDIARALLNYRLAERLLPRDDQIGANLAFARSRVADRIELSQTSQLMRQLLFPHYAWSVRERSQVAVATFLAGWSLFGLRIFLRRRWPSIVGALCLAVSAALGYSAYVQLRDEADHPIGVLAAETIVRRGDGETYEQQFNRPLGAGVEIRIVERRGDWVEVEFLDGKSGWVPGDRVVATCENGATTRQFSR